MKTTSISLALFSFVLVNTYRSQAAPSSTTDGLRTVIGETIPGKIVSVHGSAVVVATKKAQMITRLAKLDDESLNKVADFLASRPLTPPRWEGSTSIVAKNLSKNLLILQGDKLVPLVLGDRPEPEFYVAYFSAHWCPPCRRFTPVLVAEYTKLQAKYPGQFELVFLSSDESATDQAKYVRETKMPWPVVKFSATDTISSIAQWHGRGIPDLIVTNREGQVILKCYVGEDYLGPDAVLEQFAQLLDEIDSANPATRRARHRLETISHIRASASTMLLPKPYQLGLNPNHYQTLTTRDFTATLKVNALGKVTEVVSTAPELDTIYIQRFQSDAADWLFLPAASHGQAKECTVEMPVKL